jgi:competence protein ComEA
MFGLDFTDPGHDSVQPDGLGIHPNGAMNMYFFRGWPFGGAILLLASSMSCIQPDNPQDLKEKTAKATENAKRDAKAVAEGIREGWSRDKPLNLNTATKDQLLALPGITPAEADHIIAERPYHETDELLSRHILPKSKYARVADLVKAK